MGFLFLLPLLVLGQQDSSVVVAPNDPAIQYHGRWDMHDPLHPRHSWPGTFLVASFTGTHIGVVTSDTVNYYNVVIDGRAHPVFHAGGQEGNRFLLADHLNDGAHTLVLSKRNIAFGATFSFDGLLLSDTARLLPPPTLSPLRIEFIGDSFTAAESNETTAPSLPWLERMPVTNIDLGFAPVIARHFMADYHTTCRSGSGMVCDWQGDTTTSMPALFHRTLMEAPAPAWDFRAWVPQVVVIALGLNDLSGLRGSDGAVSEQKSLLFRRTYHAFLQRLRTVYPGAKFFAVAAHPEWIRRNVRQIVDEECASGRSDIRYAHFDEFPGGYVANGHPTVSTHAKIAAQIIAAMEAGGVRSVRQP